MSAAAKRFVPSNPGGRPARPRGTKMVEYIAKATEDGQLMASFFVRTLKGLEKGTNVSHKIRAAEWLADRFAGKAVEVALTGDIDSPNNPLAELDATELRALIHKIVKHKNSPKPPDTLPAVETTSLPAVETTSEQPPAQPPETT